MDGSNSGGNNTPSRTRNAQEVEANTSATNALEESSSSIDIFTAETRLPLTRRASDSQLRPQSEDVLSTTVDENSGSRSCGAIVYSEEGVSAGLASINIREKEASSSPNRATASCSTTKPMDVCMDHKNTLPHPHPQDELQLMAIQQIAPIPSQQPSQSEPGAYATPGRAPNSITVLPSSSPPADPHDGPVTAVCVDHDDLEQKIRQEIIQASSRADVIQVETGHDDKEEHLEALLKKSRRRYALLAGLFAILMMGILVAVVLTQNDNNSNSHNQNNKAGPGVTLPENEQSKDEPTPSKPEKFSLEWSLGNMRKRGYLSCGVGGDPSWDDETNAHFHQPRTSHLQKEQVFVWGERDPTDTVLEGLLQWEKDKLLDRAATNKEYDICRAMGAAILGKGGESKVHIAHAWDWHTSILQSKMDFFVGTIRPTIANDVYVADRKNGFTFSAPYYYQGLRFAGNPKSVQCAEALSLGMSVTSPLQQQCNQTTICARETSLSLQDNTLLPGLGEVPSTQIVSLDPEEDILFALANGTCHAVADYAPALEEQRAREAGFDGEYTIGNTVVSKEPLTIDTYDKIPELSTLLNWVLLALFEATRHGIVQSNAQEFPASSYLGKGNEEVFRNALRAVGNMEEIIGRDETIRDAGDSPIDEQTSGALVPRPLGPSGSQGLGLSTRSVSVAEILKRGRLRCAVRANRLGFAVRLEDAASIAYTGLDIDMCRALAAGLFGEKADPPVEFLEVSTLADGYDLLSSNDVDVMVGAIWSLQNDIHEPTAGESFIFSQPYFYRPADNSSSDMDLDANLCLVTSSSDEAWASLLQWTALSTLYAEAQGIGMEESQSMPSIDSFGPSLKQFLQRVIATVGNYNELYERNLGWLLPRSGRNLLNGNPQRTIQGPSVYVPPGFEFM